MRYLRLLRIISFVLLAFLLVASPVLAYLYRAPITVTETNGTAYAMLPVSVPISSVWMAANGFMEPDALDTRVETLGGSAKSHMVADDRVTFASAIPASSQTNLYFTTGNSDLASLDIVTGYGGYFTMIDDPALEPGASFEIEVSSSTFTLPPVTDGTIVSKSRSTHLYTSGNQFVSRIYSTGDRDQTTTDSTLSINGAAGSSSRIGQYFDVSAIGGNWQGIVSAEFYIGRVGAPMGTAYCSAWKASDGSSYGNLGSFDVALFAPGWNTFNTAQLYFEPTDDIIIGIQYTGGDAGNYIEITTNSASVVNNENLRRYDVNTAAWVDVPAWETAYRNLQFIEVASELSAVSTSGSHVVKSTYDGATHKLFIDDMVNPKDTDAWAGTALNSNYGWGVMSYDTASLDYLKITVGGVLIAWYQPIDMIHGFTYSTGTVTVTNGDATVTGAGGATFGQNLVGSIFSSADGLYYVVDSVTNATTLELTTVYAGGTLAGQAYWTRPRIPDRQGAAQDGAIVWGTNPAGVSASIGSMVSSGQSSTSVSTDTSTSDVLPPVGGSDWRPVAGVSAALMANPLRPVVTAISDNTTLSEYQVWVWLGIIFVVFITVLVGSRVRGHHLITGIAASAAIVLLVVWTIFPLLSLVAVVLAIVGGLISERSPSL
jgi:hypothetical protein